MWVLLDRIAQTLQSWVLNFQKSPLEPTHCFEYLGVLLDTVQDRDSLPQKKLQMLTDCFFSPNGSLATSRKVHYFI